MHLRLSEGLKVGDLVVQISSPCFVWRISDFQTLVSRKTHLPERCATLAFEFGPSHMEVAASSMLIETTDLRKVSDMEAIALVSQ